MTKTPDAEDPPRINKSVSIMARNFDDSVFGREAWAPLYYDIKKTIFSAADKRFKTVHDVELWFDELFFLIRSARKIPDKYARRLLSLARLAKTKCKTRLSEQNHAERARRLLRLGTYDRVKLRNDNLKRRYRALPGSRDLF